MPWFAVSRSPCFSPCAPVNAPRSWPKSSLSRRVSWSAPQSRMVREVAARGLLAWRARATSSLPVPLSPWIRTGESVRAALLTRASTRLIPGLRPTISGKGVMGRERRLEMQGLAPVNGLLVGRPQNMVQVLEIEGLRDEVEGAVSSDLRRCRHGTAGGGDDDLWRRGHGADRPKGVRSRHAGQVQVEKDYADIPLGDLVDPFLSGSHGPDRIPERREHPPKKAPDGGVLMDYQDYRLVHLRKKALRNFSRAPLSRTQGDLSRQFNPRCILVEIEVGSRKYLRLQPISKISRSCI